MWIILSPSKFFGKMQILRIITIHFIMCVYWGVSLVDGLLGMLLEMEKNLDPAKSEVGHYPHG